MYEPSKRTDIYINGPELKAYYQPLMKTDYFKKNIDLFTCAVLVGKFIVKDFKKLDDRKQYIKVNDNLKNNNLIILKCLAISEVEDISILTAEEELYTICEEYATVGIETLHKWYSKNKYNFNDFLAEKLLEIYEEIDLRYFE